MYLVQEPSCVLHPPYPINRNEIILRIRLLDHQAFYLSSISQVVLAFPQNVR
jgi:hypothetical protein